jgi:hypothetical protein
MAKKAHDCQADEPLAVADNLKAATIANDPNLFRHCVSPRDGN